MSKETPMMKQYLSIKDEHQDALLLFRLGDFYELFFDDAIKASKVLEITLTSRDKKKDPIPMCGVPYHSAKSYIEKLINYGFKVAICEQMEDPKTTKGMVNREVVRIITPGTLIDDFGIDDEKSNYILSLLKKNNDYVVSYSDISTGEIYAFTTSDLAILKSELNMLSPREIVTQSNSKDFVTSVFNDLPLISEVDVVEEYKLNYSANISIIEKEALNLLLTYIYQQNKKELKHFRTVEKHVFHHYMQLSSVVIKNLELIESLQTKKTKGSLYWYLNQTSTPMGKRKLKKWIERPLTHLDKIRERQYTVETLLEHFIEREDLKNLLNHVYDIERLVGRLSFGNIDAKDFVHLSHSFESLPAIQQLLIELQLDSHELFRGFDDLNDLYEVLSKSLKDTPPKTIRDGNIFKDGYDEKLDELRYLTKNGQEWLQNYIEKERTRTGIKQMKIGFNKVFGYYIEISKANAINFDAEKYNFNRKQTLTNAERFITPELKEMESNIINAEEESVLLEYRLFQNLKRDMEQHIQRIQNTAEIISTLDCLISFAQTSNEHQLVKPTFTKDTLNIVEGRHPVVEKVIGAETYVANNIDMDASNFMYLITGPNMSGKSTYMRQIAIISIMAQMGMYVPAKNAELPIFDKVFTRIGASDDLASGKSTFMIEMLEANDALKNATKNSLLIFDEIGRGTSTYDGMALAQAILEHIHHHIGAKTLFSTHYHEITKLDKELSGLSNVHVKASLYDGKLVFLHKVKPGAVEQSYGIHVAKLADLPDEVTTRAHNLLKEFETGSNQINDIDQLELPLDDYESGASSIEERIKEIDTFNITALEALNILHELKSELN